MWIISSGRDVDYDDTKIEKEISSVLAFGGGEIEECLFLLKCYLQ